MSEPENPHLFFNCIDNTDGQIHAITNITLRDLFAGFALVGLLSRPIEFIPEHHESSAAAAYQFADAMLKERGQEN